MAYQEEWTVERPNKKWERISDKEKKASDRWSRKESNHQRRNISLVDIHPFNASKTPLVRCWRVMWMFINKTKATIRMVTGEWLGGLYPSSPNNKGSISVCRMPIPMTTCTSSFCKLAYLPKCMTINKQLEVCRMSHFRPFILVQWTWNFFKKRSREQPSTLCHIQHVQVESE